MSRRRCCCGTGTGTGTAGCVVFSTSFTGPDGTDVGSDWLEYGGPGTGTSGPFRIANNKLAITGGNGETLECLHTVPSDVGTGTANPDHYLVYASVGFDTDRDRAQVKVDDQAVYIELERYSVTRGQLRIFEDDVCKGSRNVPLYPSNTIVVCVDGTMVHVSMGAAELLSIPHTTVSGIVHLSAFCTGTVTFDDFVLSEHYYDDATCPDCRNEDCEWFFDSGFDSGELSDTDYIHALGTGTGTAEGGWDYYNNAIRCTQDGRLQIAVTAPRGNTGTVLFAFSWSGIPTGLTIFFSYDGSDTGVQITKESDGGVYARWFISGEQVGLTTILARAAVYLCWDGEFLIGDAGGAVYSLGTTISSFTPTVEVGGLTSGYVLITQIEATKTGDLLEPVRECPECDEQDCGCVPFYNTATLTLSGITVRDPWPDATAPMPYDMSCPESVVFHLEAVTVHGEYDSRIVKCMWAGYTDYVVPYCCDSYGVPTWVLVRLFAEVTITNVDGGIALTAQVGTVSESSIPHPGQGVTGTPCSYGASFVATFEETLLGTHVSCDSIPDMALAATGCNQYDATNPFAPIFAFLACQFCNCVNNLTVSPTPFVCSDKTTPLTLDFASPDPDA